MSMYTQRIMTHMYWEKVVPFEELEDWRNLTISDIAYRDGFHVLKYAVYFWIPTNKLEMVNGCRIRMGK